MQRCTRARRCKTRVSAGSCARFCTYTTTAKSVWLFAASEPVFAQLLLLSPDCSLQHSAPTNCRELARAGLSLVIARKGHDTSSETV